MGDFGLKLLLAYGLRGSKPLSRLLCHALKYHGVDALILLGDTASPTIVKWLYETCSAKVLGLLGRYDDVATVTALSNINGLIECRSLNVKGVLIYGIGLSGCVNIAEEKVDIVVSSLPGFKYGCCNPKVDVVDHVIELLKPRLVITGSCRKPCKAGDVFSPGSIALGYIGLLELDGGLHYKVRAVNLHSLHYFVVGDKSH